MKINLLPDFEKDCNTIGNMLRDHGWEWEEEFLLSKTFNGIKAHIQLSIKPLWYTYNIKTEESTDTYTPWISLTFTLHHNDEGEVPTEGYILAKMIKEEMRNMPIKPFYDEDATHGIYSTLKKEHYTNYTFYMNPDIPDGWWENHTL